MAITEQPSRIDQAIQTDDTPALRVPRAWRDDRAQADCTCPELCLVDHDN